WEWVRMGGRAWRRSATKGRGWIPPSGGSSSSDSRPPGTAKAARGSGSRSSGPSRNSMAGGRNCARARRKARRSCSPCRRPEASAPLLVPAPFLVALHVLVVGLGRLGRRVGSLVGEPFFGDRGEGSRIESRQAQGTGRLE